jgi:hypothetical protein
MRTANAANGISTTIRRTMNPAGILATAATAASSTA